MPEMPGSMPALSDKAIRQPPSEMSTVFTGTPDEPVEKVPGRDTGQRSDLRRSACGVWRRLVTS